MASYFRKSFKIAPGIHINLSKRGTGISIGARGAHISLSPTGRVTKTVNLPGTGIYYRDVDTLHSKPKSKQPHLASPIPESPTPEEPTARQVVAVEHHGFYISHGFAAFFFTGAAVVVNVRYGSHPLNRWVPVLGVVGVISLILWLMDLTQSSVYKRNHFE